MGRLETRLRRLEAAEEIGWADPRWRQAVQEAPAVSRGEVLDYTAPIARYAALLGEDMAEVGEDFARFAEEELGWERI